MPTMDTAKLQALAKRCKAAPAVDQDREDLKACGCEDSFLGCCAAVGFDWGTILQWILQYGYGVVAPVLSKLAMAYISGQLNGVPFKDILDWTVKALAAQATGQPLPPLPSPPVPAPVMP